MKLQKWLDRNNMSHKNFGQLVGVTASAIWYYVNGIKIPRPETMAKIVAYTKGEVTANDFYGIQERDNINNE